MSEGEEIHISLVPQEHVPEAWPYVVDFIKEAIFHTDGRYTIDDVYTLVMQHGYLLWVALGENAMKGAAVTSFATYPRKKVLCIMILGGNEFRTWKTNMLGTLQRFAKEQGCECIEATGREGWARTLKQDGFKPLWHTFELPLEPVSVGA